MDREELQWRPRARRVIRQTPIFDLEELDATAIDGMQRRFVRLVSPDWVNVVARDDQDRFVMVIQHRHGTGELTCEFPAGMVESFEDPVDAAARELEEETGLVARRWRHIGTVHPNPAFMTNRCHTFLADGISADGRTAPDPGERIEVTQVPVATLNAEIGTGWYTNAMTVVAHSWFRRCMGEGADRNRTGA